MGDLSAQPDLPPATIEQAAFRLVRKWRLWVLDTRDVLQDTRQFVAAYGLADAAVALGDRAPDIQVAYQALRNLLKTHSDNNIDEPGLTG